MKQKFLILLLAFVGAFSIHAQDLLVTVNFDTLNCKIGQLIDDQYQIKFILDNTEMTGLIHKDSIFYSEKNVFRSMDSKKLKTWYPVVDVGIDGGVMHQIGAFRIDDDLTDKSAFGAKTGFYAGADLTLYVSKGIGYGLKYHYRSFLDGDVTYQYVGGGMVFRFWEKSKFNQYRFRNDNKSNHFFFGFSAGLGWMNQINAPIQRDISRQRIEMYARGLSGDISFGYDLRLSKLVSARIKASCFIGYPSYFKNMSLEYLGVKPNEPPLDISGYCDNMNTINISAGFTFHK